MKKLLLLAAILLITSAAARADNCPGGTSATLADYIALGSCTIPFTGGGSWPWGPVSGTMALSGFSYTPGSGAPLASQINVTFNITDVRGPYCIKWYICTALDMSFGGLSTTTSLSGSLDFSADSGGMPFAVADLSLAPHGVLASGASIAVQAALSNGRLLSTEILNLPSPTGVDQPLSRVWFTREPSRALSIHDSFQANAGSSGSPLSFGFTNRLVTPEPATLGLLGLGSLGIAAWRRKKTASRSSEKGPITSSSVT